MPKIPDRWIPYKACGKVIEGTRFICFKVPLKKSVQSGISAIQGIWDIPALLLAVPTLGAVIDLTNTARYYDPMELQKAGILYKKIFMPGRIIPPENSVKEFINAVDEFLGKDCVAVQVKRARLGLSLTESLIGVHCTHGLNRTGYMVCRYMRDRLGVPAKDAIKKFEKARGYQIERENYIADLLGNKPPPPDVGKHTLVKPLNKNDMTYRSPLGYEDEDDQQRGYGNSNRYGSSNRYGNSSNRYGNGSSGSWRSGPSGEGYSGSGARRGRTDSNTSFDFSRDY